MKLTGKQKHYLRGVAHSKNPIVTIGSKGLIETVMMEIESALEHHELVKIKLPGGDKAEKVSLMAQITEQSGSESVQLIGRVGVIYRANAEPRLSLPSA